MEKDLIIKKSNKLFITQIILTIISVLFLFLTPVVFSSNIFGSGNIPLFLLLVIVDVILAIVIISLMITFFIKGIKIYKKLKILRIVDKKLLFSSIFLLFTAPLIHLILSILSKN